MYIPKKTNETTPEVQVAVMLEENIDTFFADVDDALAKMKTVQVAEQSAIELSDKLSAVIESDEVIGKVATDALVSSVAVVADSYRVQNVEDVAIVAEADAEPETVLVAASEGIKEIIATGWAWLKEQLAKAGRYIRKAFQAIMSKVKNLDGVIEEASKTDKEAKPAEMSEKDAKVVAKRHIATLVTYDKAIDQALPTFLATLREKNSKEISGAVNTSFKVFEGLTKKTHKAFVLTIDPKDFKVKYLKPLVGKIGKDADVAKLSKLVGENVALDTLQKDKNANVTILGTNGRSVTFGYSLSQDKGFKSAVVTASIDKKEATKAVEAKTGKAEWATGKDIVEAAKILKGIKTRDADAAVSKIEALTGEFEKLMENNKGKTELRDVQVAVNNIAPFIISIVRQEIKDDYTAKSDFVSYYKAFSKALGSKPKEEVKDVKEEDEVLTGFNY